MKATAASALLSGCGNFPSIDPNLPKISALQASRKRKQRSPIALIQADEYTDQLFELIKPFLQHLDLPDLKGKQVILKPNMVEIREGHPVTTNAAVLQAAVELAKYLGAKEIIVAEGAGHMRDTEYLLHMTGVGNLCKKLSLEFRDLNIDELVEVENPDGFSNFKTILLPKTILEADVLVSVPKMKCHHWVGMTCSMKNLFGCIPGSKYGWPKNQIHWNGIKETVIDLVHLLKPSFALVDAIVAMEGDGPINGIARHSKFMLLGTDLAALDATCARSMSIGIDQLPYVQLAGEVIGNIDPQMIDIYGATLDSVTQVFKLPITLSDKSLQKDAKTSGS